eukprot:TRINITY_DN5922_c0_g1_i1.p1 TRINITY_DN5922_c0_g1~~TRINITY_DN5922_c0_g1_i1.p1  ORF type:complete len:345 (-),score=107.45 TRINITY_DN5922_c0_g1_i1:83-1117(-)
MRRRTVLLGATLCGRRGLLSTWSNNKFPKSVRIVEVGPRDGLQNESGFIQTDLKVNLIKQLVRAGLSHVEVGAFVHPKWVPQMADTPQVLGGLAVLGTFAPVSKFSVLTPNLKGFEGALKYKSAGVVDQVAVFTAASEAFTKKNINCTIKESLERFLPVVEAAKKEGIEVRGYVSTVLGCPYQGDVNAEEVAQVSKDLFDMGCAEISLGDTIGVGTPGKTQRMLEAVLSTGIPVEKCAVHFHDTYGQALANILASLELGISVVDSSISGLGGCPYADGASGNVATEDVVYMLHGLGIETGVSLDNLLDVNEFVGREMFPGRKTNSKAAAALITKRNKKRFAASQ